MKRNELKPTDNPVSAESIATTQKPTSFQSLQTAVAGTALPPTVLSLGYVSLLTDIATEAMFPLMPAFFKNVLHSGKFGMGLAEGLAETVSGITKLLSGRLSDRWKHRKTFILVGYGLAGLIRPLTGLTTQVWQAVGIRCLDRLGKGVRGAPRDALIAASVSPDQRGRAFGYHRSMDHAGAAIGPLLAAAFLYLFPGSFRMLFLLTMIPGVAVLFVVWFGVRDVSTTATTHSETETSDTGLGDSDPAETESTLEHESRRSNDASGNIIVRAIRWSGLPELGPRFRWYLLAITLFTLSNSTDLFLLERLEARGLPSVLTPIVWFGFSALKSGLSLWGGRLADHFSSWRLVLIGWLLYTAVYAGFGIFNSLPALITLFVPYALHFGITESAEKKLVADLAPDDAHGTAFGWFHTCVGLMAAPASILFGLIAETAAGGSATAFLVSAAMTTTAMFCLIAAMRAPSLQRN